jgi:hypothetical protein
MRCLVRQVWIREASVTRRRSPTWLLLSAWVLICAASYPGSAVGQLQNSQSKAEPTLQEVTVTATGWCRASRSGPSTKPQCSSCSCPLCLNFAVPWLRRSD